MRDFFRALWPAVAPPRLRRPALPARRLVAVRRRPDQPTAGPVAAGPVDPTPTQAAAPQPTPDPTPLHIPAVIGSRGAVRGRGRRASAVQPPVLPAPPPPGTSGGLGPAGGSHGYRDPIGAARSLGRAVGTYRKIGSTPSSRAALSSFSTGQPASLVSKIPGLLEPPSHNQSWRLQDIDLDILQTMTPAAVLEMLVDLSPEISRGLWDFLRMANAGWNVEAIYPNSERPHPKGQKALNEFMDVLRRRHGSVDVILDRMLIGGFLRGAFFGEIVLDPQGRKPLDIATPDPATARFRSVEDSVYGQTWELGQIKNREWKSLNFPTVRYIPIDALPSVPYGRAIGTSAVFMALFLLGLLHDLRRVVSQQGYPRLDLVVNLKALVESMPIDLQEKLVEDPAVFQAYVDSIIGQVSAAYNDLDPADSYVHTDIVTVNRPVGAIDGSSLGAVGGLITSLERMITRALKTMPLLMALTEGLSEGNANRQWEIHVAGIKSLQHKCEHLLELLLEQALQASGIVCEVKWRFSELRVAEMLRDAQVQKLNLENAYTAWKLGYTSHEESSHMAVGHAPDQPEPRSLPDPAETGGGVVGGTPDPGEANQETVAAQMGG